MSERLIKRIEDNRELRSRIKRNEQNYNDHMSVITSSADILVLDFWCKSCSKDVSATGHKRVGTAGVWPTAWYVAKCLCGGSLLRRLTDKSKDEYFRLSENIKYQRVRNYNDMLTPADDLFKVIYPKEYARITSKQQ